MGKNRIIKKFELLPPELLELLQQSYPDGYEDSLITFQTATGELATGVPLETDETYYLIRMPTMAVNDDDDDYENDESGDTDNFENLDSLQIADDADDEDD